MQKYEQISLHKDPRLADQSATYFLSNTVGS